MVGRRSARAVTHMVLDLHSDMLLHHKRYDFATGKERLGEVGQKA
jgi:hypothetical protein